jgi:hypothetical protein
MKMAVSKQEYQEWKSNFPKYAILHKLHAEDVNRQFGGIPRAIIMSWEDYDRYIHLNDLCAYDLLLVILGPGVMLGQPPFLLDSPRNWSLAIGRHTYVIAEGAPDGDYYRVSFRSATAQERKGR